MPLSSRSKLDIVGFQLLKTLTPSASCDVPVGYGSASTCNAPGVMVLRFMYRTRSGAIKTAHEVQCEKHLQEWKLAHGEQLDLFAR